MPSASEKRLREGLEGCGVAEKNIRFFGQQHPKPNLQEYLTLNDLRWKNKPAPDGVAEHQGRPILYFVDEQRLTEESPQQNLFEPSQLPTIFRQLVCRGERAYLARVQFGKVVVAPVSPTEREPAWKEYTPNSTEGKCLFSRLAFGFSEGEDFAAGDAVFDRLFRLLKHVANKIAQREDLRQDALSLVGRALFFRFLQDRQVLEGYPVKKIAANATHWSDCFANPQNASDTCRWLDTTFNGDFLPLPQDGSKGYFEQIGQSTNGHVFDDLSAIVRGHEPSGNDYQPLLSWKWQEFDFAHIPVGLLSQVYEAFSWEWTPKEARSTSRHYTPRNIAVTLLDEVFHKLPDITNCRVLDPACGAGVFLVLAFRRLYLELWRKNKTRERPGTKDIRRILGNQLVGLDINDSALKLAALSLYLTAIELDPEPRPPDKLKFKNLRGCVLYDVREPSADGTSPTLGSLGTHLGTEFDHQFDVVISNPPWTSVDENLGQRMCNVCQTAIARIDREAARTYRHPDNNPDLPFLWKSTQWCKSDGRIAMALPARLLLKTKARPVAARRLLFELVQIDGIINGTNLRETQVWPDMKQPWIMLFAKNKRPPSNHATHLITLPNDTVLNRVGQFRIDSESTRTIGTSISIAQPWLWKTLTVGTVRDVEIVEKMKGAGGVPLNRYWDRTVGVYRNGKGYTRGKPEQRTRSANHLRGLPHLNQTDAFRFVVDAADLPAVPFRKVQWPRRETIYEPPLTLIKESPGEDRVNGRALLAFEKLAYNESFTGYSAAGRPDGELLVRYLHLFVHSDVWLYYVLMTSPQFGAERRRIHKADLEQCPITPFDKLTDGQRQKLVRLSASLEQKAEAPWEEIDAFFASLYGLRDYDLQVIRDTLSVALPYETARQRACAPPTEAEKNAFEAFLKKSLAPVVATTNGKLAVQRWKSRTPGGRITSPFELLVLTSIEPPHTDIGVFADGLLDQILDIADKTGATQIIQPDPPRLVVGIYNQYRYWTLTRARLLVGDILRLYLDAITG
jgi:SAM-dependent methyltransferase